MTERIPREFIQQLLNRVDLIELIDNRVPLRKKTGQNFFACCPFHDEKSASFSVSQAKQFYYCFGCGAHGNAIDFLMQYDRLSFPESIEALAKQVGVEVPKEIRNNDKREENFDALYDLMGEISKYYQKELRQAEGAINYLKNRGITGEIAKKFEIGVASPGWDHVLKTFEKDKQHLSTLGMLIKKDDGGYYDRFRDRIMFPILDRQGRTIGFGGRIIDQGEPKYLNSPETPIFQKGHELYGLYQALQANRQLQRALIVEGYMDVIALFQLGITYSVATLGTATTATHIKKLLRYTSDILFCFDGDKAGRTAAWRALLVTLPVMQDGLQVRFMFLPEGEDPDTLVRKEGKTVFEQRIQKAMPLSDFFFQTIAEQADLTSADGRARFIKLSKEHLDTLPQGMFKDIMFEELAKKARLSSDHFTTPKARVKATQRPTQNQTASPLQLAMTLLIQNPQLIEHLAEPIPVLDIQEFSIFCKIVEILKIEPKLTTGALLEHWRDQEESQMIAKLAQVEHLIPIAGIQNEFIDSLKRLKKLARAQKIEKMLSLAAISGLSDQEKQDLSALIQEDKG